MAVTFALATLSPRKTVLALISADGRLVWKKIPCKRTAGNTGLASTTSAFVGAMLAVAAAAFGTLCPKVCPAEPGRGVGFGELACVGGAGISLAATGTEFDVGAGESAALFPLSQNQPLPPNTRSKQARAR